MTRKTKCPPRFSQGRSGPRKRRPRQDRLCTYNIRASCRVCYISVVLSTAWQMASVRPLAESFGSKTTQNKIRVIRDWQTQKTNASYPRASTLECLCMRPQQNKTINNKLRAIWRLWPHALGPSTSKLNKMWPLWGWHMSLALVIPLTTSGTSTGICLCVQDSKWNKINKINWKWMFW